MQKFYWFFLFFFSCAIISAQTNRYKDSAKTYLLIEDFYTLVEKKPKIALKKIELLFQLAKKNNYKKSLYYYHFWSGYYYFIFHKRTISLNHFKKSKIIAQQLQLLEEEIGANNWIANVYYLKKEAEKAAKLYLENIKLASKIDFTEGIISSYFGLASLEIDKKKSLTYLLIIDSICKVKNYKSAVLANAYESVSSIYFNQLKNREKGINYLKLFLKTSKEVNYYSGINYASTVLGELAFEDQKYDLAKSYFNKNLKRSQQNNIPIQTAHNLVALAMVEIAMQDLKSAEKKLTRALKTFTTLQDSILVDLTRLNLAQVYIGLSKLKKAEAVIFLCENRHLDNVNFRAQFLKTSIKFYTAKKDFKKAFFSQKKLIRLEKLTTEKENLKDFLVLENKYKASERKQEIKNLQTTAKAVKLKNKNQKIVFTNILLISLLFILIITYAYKKKQQTTNYLKEKVQKLNDRNPNKKNINNADKRFLLELEKIITTKILDPTFSVEVFAKLMHISRMQLHRKLKKITHLSTTKFIKTERLKVAEKLLLSSNSSISEIAYHCGFKDVSYFSKQFKSVYKKTPSSYRESKNVTYFT